MKSLEEQWEKLRLMEEEKRNVEPNDSIPEEIKNKGDRSLVGKVWMERKISQGVIESTIAKVWKLSRVAKFLEVGKNVFVIIFATHTDKHKVWGGKPWLFNNQLMVLQIFDGFIPPLKMIFEREDLWVQKHNLPLAYMTKKRGEQLGSAMGKVVDVDVQDDGSGWGCCLRVFIEMDLTKPLARGRTITAKVTKCGSLSGMRNSLIDVYLVVG
ncbi:hypothetical protein F2P56_021970 [Juglans regia]|uniref:DUF4283 domain-containing protein n=2 Tax=Juglans regia TaxID=51240 RepID=A0A833TYG9_JUGRE|nr:uncharacterized protein LOC108983380 [Juglans regia]KAF5457896.1 hypothetical protein F2P56_021970 [Juglans regia]